MQQDCSLGGKEKRCSPFLCHLTTGAGLMLGALKLNLCVVKAVAEKLYPDPMFAELMPFSALIIHLFFFPLKVTAIHT